MNYSIVFHKEAKNEFDKLDGSIKILVLKQLKKISDNPLIGETLGNKGGYDLSGYRKIYVNKKQVRIVYKIIENKLEIFIISINKRDKMEAYKVSSKRK